jgi:hypothetical protein
VLEQRGLGPKSIHNYIGISLSLVQLRQGPAAPLGRCQSL